jgi:transcriptional regulator with XRE-family HTH domain
MKNENTKKFLDLVSQKDSGWLEKAKWRQENEDWLDISFNIAIKVASTLSANKKTGTFPKSQVELAEAMGCSAQYVNKLLRGQENLQIETICKVERILKIKLIEVPTAYLKQTIPYNSMPILIEKTKVSSPAFHTSNPYVTANEVLKGLGEINYALSA